MTPGTGKFFPNKKSNTNTSSNDIIKRLRDIASLRGEMGGRTIPIACTEAADEIERLRKAGDALAHGIRTGRWDDALDAWTEVRDD